MLRHSFITFLGLVIRSFAMPLVDDDDDDGCGSEPAQLGMPTVDSLPSAAVQDSPSPAILSTPTTSPSQHPHATVPMVQQPHTQAILLGTMFTVALTLLAFILVARYVARRRATANPLKVQDLTKPQFPVFRQHKSTPSAKRLSDESWVSPLLPTPGSPRSSAPQNLDPPQCKLVPITTPITTPEFGSHLEPAKPDFHIPPVRIPSPVYVPQFSPSPSLSSSRSLSPTPSMEPLNSSPSKPDRLSRLLSSTFRDDRTVISPAKPTTAHLIQTARSYAHAYRPSSMTSTSLYVPPTSSGRVSGARSRTGFYPTQTGEAGAAPGNVRDTFSTVTTADTDADTTCTVQRLLRAVSGVQPATLPFVDPFHRSGNGSAEGQTQWTLGGTKLGLKLRLSDASERARYRSREKQRERERQTKDTEPADHEREHQTKDTEPAKERLSGMSQTSAATASEGTADTIRPQPLETEVRREFKLRDSQSVLREIGW